MSAVERAAEVLDIAHLRSIAEAATPGSWCWAGNTDTGEPYLAARGPGMATSVLAIGWDPRSTTGRGADDVRSYAEESGIDPDEAVDMWANDQYGEPIKEPRLWFYRDHMAVTARNHVRFEVAPNAKTRDDPKVYRADITDVLLPDAQHMATFDPATVLALLDRITELEALAAAGCLRDHREGGAVVALKMVLDACNRRQATADALADVLPHVRDALTRRDDREGETVTEWSTAAADDMQPGPVLTEEQARRQVQTWNSLRSASVTAVLLSRQVDPWMPVTDGGA